MQPPGRMLRGRLVVLPLSAVLLIGSSAACSSAEDQAAEHGTRQVREEAHDAQRAMKEYLSGIDADSSVPLLDRIAKGITAAGGTVFNKPTIQDRAITTSAAFDATGEGSDGFSAKQVTVRLSGRAGENEPPRLEDTPCPESLPRSSGEGTVTEFVTLDD